VTDRQWLVRWALTGRPTRLPWALLRDVPEEAFRTRYEEYIVGVWFAAIGTPEGSFGWWPEEKNPWRVSVGAKYHQFSNFDDARQFLRRETRPALQIPLEPA